MLPRILFSALVLAVLGPATEAAEPPAAAEANASAAAALEVFRDECVACHRTGKAKGGLKLETLEAIKAGGESGAVINPERLSESPLLAVLSPKGDPHMPPKKQLTDAQVAAVRAWLEAGTPWDAAVMNRPPRNKPIALKPLPKGVHPVLAIAFSPNGDTLAVARGGNIELRDATAPRYPVKSTFTAETDTVQSLLWLQDSQTLVTGGFRRISFWNTPD